MILLTVDVETQFTFNMNDGFLRRHLKSDY